jgi:hypothetical protein
MDPLSKDFMVSQQLQAGQQEEDMPEWTLPPPDSTASTNGHMAFLQPYQPTLPPPLLTTPTDNQIAIRQPRQPTGFGIPTAFSMELPEDSRATRWGTFQSWQQPAAMSEYNHAPEPPLSRNVQQELLEEEARHAERLRMIVQRGRVHSAVVQEGQNAFPYSDASLDTWGGTDASTSGLPYPHIASHQMWDSNTVMDNGFDAHTLGPGPWQVQTGLQATFEPSPFNLHAPDSTFFDTPSLNLGRNYPNFQQIETEQMPTTLRWDTTLNPSLNTHGPGVSAPHSLTPIQVGSTQESLAQDFGLQLYAEAYASTPFTIRSDMSVTASAAALSLPDTIHQSTYHAPDTISSDMLSMFDQFIAPDLEVVPGGSSQAQMAVTNARRKHARSRNQTLAPRDVTSKISKSRGALDEFQIYEGPEAELQKKKSRKKVLRCFACWYLNLRVCNLLCSNGPWLAADMINSVCVHPMYPATDGMISSRGFHTSLRPRTSRATAEQNSPKFTYSPHHRILKSGRSTDKKAVVLFRKSLRASRERLHMC